GNVKNADTAANTSNKKTQNEKQSTTGSPTTEKYDEHRNHPERQLLRRQSQHDDPHVWHRRIQPGQTPPSHHPPPPLLVRPPRPTTPKPHHAAPTAQRKGPTTGKETSPLNSSSRDNPFDALRKFIEHEANQ